ncbi:hypothetical protein G3N30_11575 [Microbacterium lacticum]|uniref:alpha/beta fold hydrolase n=1 Tax=Microbacterium lacticum TaxID=33885 RepID=UPI0018B038F7|nr:hypothetical protein [Microbacterium lacticum]MBF9336828.1 hypothetical protein [Microbacterium lacticum]
MLERNVDFEDALIPIAYLKAEFYFFNTADGRIYRLANTIVPHLEPMPRGTFAIPGDDTIYAPRVIDGVLRLKLRNLADISNEEEVDLGSGYGSLPVAVIPGMSDRHVVLRSDDRTKTIFVSIDTKRSITHCIPSSARPLFMMQDGHVVYQQGQSWGSTREDHALEPGIVSNWSNERFIVVSDPKGERTYTEFFGKARRVLTPPRGWEIRQAATHRNGTLLTCLHPSLGYATWDERNLTPVEGTATLYPLGDHAPVIRTTGYALGSVWRVGAREARGVVPPRGGLHIEAKLVGDCPCVHIASAGLSEGLLVAFHGGPDSLEWDDLRYGGMYRDLLDQGMDILIVNYAGSQGFGAAHQRRAWHAWEKTLMTLGAQVQKFCDEAGYVRVKMLGVSFGAWAALVASSHAQIERIVAASPVLRLSSHLRNHNDDEQFREWATARFGDYSSIALTDERLHEGVRASVTAIMPTDDRSIDGNDTLATCRNFGWTPVEVPGGHYPTRPGDAQIRWHAIKSAILD